MSNNLKLPAELTIQSVSEEIAGLREAAAGASSALTLDASALSSIDTAGVQLLCSLVKQLHNQGCAVYWQSVPDVLTETAHILGATSALEL